MTMFVIAFAFKCPYTKTSGSDSFEFTRPKMGICPRNYSLPRYYLCKKC